jgi:hypothetical protein
VATAGVDSDRTSKVLQRFQEARTAVTVIINRTGAAIAYISLACVHLIEQEDRRWS